MVGVAGSGLKRRLRTLRLTLYPRLRPRPDSSVPSLYLALKTKKEHD